jgi:pyruvate dehydrogenase E1 component beta subunit
VTTTYIKQIIDQVNAVTSGCGPVLLYGENIDTGSRIAGLARGLTVNPAGRILNVGNCELTHCGVGFGIMIDKGNAVLFMKQLDFLLLGLDQLVNTFNYIRAYEGADKIGSFSIFLIICDQGYQGPQSSINAASDFASLANVSVFCLNAVSDVEGIIAEQFVSPGFRIICLSQRLFGGEALDIQTIAKSDDSAVYHYRSGADVTLACYNFALRAGVASADHLAKSGRQCDLFHVNFLPSGNFDAVIESVERTGKLVVMDDSKSLNKFSDRLVAELHRRKIAFSLMSAVRRGSSDREYGVDEDRFVVDDEAVAAFASGN